MRGDHKMHACMGMACQAMAWHLWSKGSMHQLSSLCCLSSQKPGVMLVVEREVQGGGVALRCIIRLAWAVYGGRSREGAGKEQTSLPSVSENQQVDTSLGNLNCQTLRLCCVPAL